MARKTFFQISFLIHFLVISVIASATVDAGISVSRKASKEIKIVEKSDGQKQTMKDDPSGSNPLKMETSMEKPKRLVAEELAHIHHFHKERVKKIKKHHEKFWLLTKVVLVLCHLALLISAYLHVAH